MDRLTRLKTSKQAGGCIFDRQPEKEAMPERTDGSTTDDSACCKNESTVTYGQSYDDIRVFYGSYMQKTDFCDGKKGTREHAIQEGTLMHKFQPCTRKSLSTASYGK